MSFLIALASLALGSGSIDPWSIVGTWNITMKAKPLGTCKESFTTPASAYQWLVSAQENNKYTVAVLGANAFAKLEGAVVMGDDGQSMLILASISPDVINGQQVFESMMANVHLKDGKISGEAVIALAAEQATTYERSTGYLMCSVVMEVTGTRG